MILIRAFQGQVIYGQTITNLPARAHSGSFVSEWRMDHITYDVTSNNNFHVEMGQSTPIF